MHHFTAFTTWVITFTGVSEIQNLARVPSDENHSWMTHNVVLFKTAPVEHLSLRLLARSPPKTLSFCFGEKDISPSNKKNTCVFFFARRKYWGTWGGKFEITDLLCELFSPEDCSVVRHTFGWSVSQGALLILLFSMLSVVLKFRDFRPLSPCRKSDGFCCQLIYRISFE